MPASSPNRKAAIAAVLAVLAVVAGAVVISTRGGGDDPATAVDRPAPGTCNPPPPLPSAPPSFTEVPDDSIAQGRTWQATLVTSCGDIVLELYGDKAPQTVSSFIFLARHDYWQDSPCHRLVPQGIYVLQCGDPTGTGTGSPGYGYGIENAPPDGAYPRGTLAMARSADPKSNGGQFFIVFDDTRLPVAGGGYSIFGRVVDGMDVVDRIAEAGVVGGAGDGPPQQPISVLDVTVTAR